MKENISQHNGGLHKDTSFVNQPTGTNRFVLNGINETELGDNTFISNEESNEQCWDIGNNIPLGKCYLPGNRTVIISINPEETQTQIGVVDETCYYNLIAAVDNLGHTLKHQIDITYRLRLGCEDTIYFTDGNIKPMYFNLSRPEEFYVEGTTNFDPKKFELQRTVSSIPEISTIEVKDSGGQLEPGSYNFAIQLLDENLNPTEWTAVTKTINIYNSNQTEPFIDIEGSVNDPNTDYLAFGKTSKSIELTIDPNSLDTTFPFYRVAIIEATNRTGLVSRVGYSDRISTESFSFTYTGLNFLEEGTEEEINQFTSLISTAEHIEQIENTLILSNTKGSQVNFCKLQKFVSKIQVDTITKTVILNDIKSRGSGKNPLINLEDLGYMPGEIYSLGLVYLFANGETSPVYHIPGKSPNVDSSVIFNRTGDNVFPMSNNNSSVNNKYIDNSTCENFWGVDSEGESLTDKPVRHHRFPERKAINKALIERTPSTNSSQNNFYIINLQAFGTGFSTLEEDQDTFVVRVNYTVQGIADTFDLIINTATDLFVEDSGDVSLNINVFSDTIISDDISDIVITSVQEEDIDGIFQNTSTRGINYDPIVQEANYSSTEDIVSTEIFGLQLSNIEIPSLKDTGGEKIIGYYIVRNERTEEEKTILDSGVLVPSFKTNKYTSTGLLTPETNQDNFSKRVFGLIHPEHKFLDKEYRSVSSITQQGVFKVDKYNKSTITFNDVQPGSSFDKDLHKGDRDKDGWSLWIILRDAIVSFARAAGNFTLQQDKIKDIFYLNGLESKNITNDSSTDDIIYNLAPDNKVGIVISDEDIQINRGQLPYIYLNRENTEPYSNFRVDPYYRASENIHTTAETLVVFGGDNYISPIRYVNTMFYQNQIANRKGRSSIGRKILGALAVVVGVVITVFTAGIASAAGVALAGAGIALFASGVEIDKATETYEEEVYSQLRKTLLDSWVTQEFVNYRPGWNANAVERNGGKTSDGPADDTIEWLADCVTDLWFDTQINTMLRHKYISDVPINLNAPGFDETGNQFNYTGWGYFGRDFLTTPDSNRRPISRLEQHVAKKLTVPAFDDDSVGDNRYTGLPFSEQYLINLDYQRIEKQKPYFHLPIEYDCCSKCQETFPHRNHYSQQSFQEESTDNYRVFLPNNYRDIEGETGVITDTFRLNNNFYIHTEEALWRLPQNIQERVTDDIVSFIGTGEFFNIPPRKIMDEQLSSGGTQHKWATLKTKYGVYFISDRERKIYKFNGQSLSPVSNKGLEHWFKNNNIKLLEEHLQSNKTSYPFDNNPSNKIGVGYISTYDTSKERVIFTKQDRHYNDNLLDTSDFILKQKGETIVLFNNLTETIEEQKQLGFEYEGIEDCKLKFVKESLEEVIVERNTFEAFPNTADIIAYLDVSGSFDNNARQSIVNAVTAWETQFRQLNPDWIGNVFFIGAPTGPQPIGGGEEGGGERWLLAPLESVNYYYQGEDLSQKDLINIIFTNESSPNYHGNEDTYNNSVDPGTSTFVQDRESFINTVNQFNSYSAISYPIHFGDELEVGSFTVSGLRGLFSNLLQQQLATLKGRNWTEQEFNSLTPNPFIPDWNTTFKDSLVNNSIPVNITEEALENYGLEIITNRTDANGVISSEDFQEDINGLLLGKTVVTPFEDTINQTVTEIKYIEGEEVEEEDIFKADNSYTISYDIKRDHWISWHSYLPSFYYEISEKFFSWKNKIQSFWKHNVLGKYGSFYGDKYDFIIENIPYADPIKTKIVDHIRLHTEAKKYNEDLKEYVEERYRTFDKAIIYNTRQCTGEIDLIVKDTRPNEEDYLLQQIQNPNVDSVIIDRNEREWTFNDIRDIRTDYTQPIFSSNIEDRQEGYYIDKVLNTSTLDFNKDWTQLESFRDKYLVVRLIFNNFEDVKLIMNYSFQNENPSYK